MNKILQVFIAIIWLLLALGFIKYTFSWFSTFLTFIADDTFFYVLGWVGYITIISVAGLLTPFLLITDAFKQADEVVV